MAYTPKFLLAIKQQYPDLTGKYLGIADYILKNPDCVIRLKVKELANACVCDNALIIRFCQKIGYSGFSELKASIATELMPAGTLEAAKKSGPGDSFGKLKENFLLNNNKAMNDTMGLLSKKDIDKAIKILTGAERIFLSGAGASGIVAQDTYVKLMRLGFNAVYNQDSELSNLLFGLAEPRDAMLAISFSGENKTVCAAVKAACDKGVKVVAITNFPNSALAGLADVVLLSASDEQTFRIGAMTSRIAQYLVTDFLMINLALKNMDKSGKNVLSTNKMLELED